MHLLLVTMETEYKANIEVYYFHPSSFTYLAPDAANISAQSTGLKNSAVNCEAKSAYVKSGR